MLKLKNDMQKYVYAWITNIIIMYMKLTKNIHINAPLFGCWWFYVTPQTEAGRAKRQLRGKQVSAETQELNHTERKHVHKLKTT